MADYYLRHGEYPVYAAVPTGASWPLDAQDGDGLGTGIAVSAIASIDFTGVTSVAGELIAIMGATLTCAASPAVNQFGVLTGAALATSVAGAINAATNTVNSGATAALAQLRDMCYARVNPLNTAMVQIMTRPGSATLNHAGNSNVAITETMAANPAIVQFAGGVSGAWGYLWNAPPEGTASTATIWPSAKAINTYGVVYSAAAARPLVGPVLTIGDLVNTKGNDAVVSKGTAATNVTIGVTAQISLLVDDGSIWPGSTGALTIKSEALNQTFQVNFYSMQGVWGAKTKDQLIFKGSGTGAATLRLYANFSSTKIVLHNALLWDEFCPVYIGSINNGNDYYYKLDSCHYRFDRNVSYNILGGIFNVTDNTFEIVDTVFEWLNLSSAAVPLIGSSATTGVNTLTIILRNCEAIGANPRIFSYGSNYQYLSAKNMKGFDLSGTLLGLMGGYASTTARSENGYCLMQNVGAGRAMRLETNTSVLDWNPAGGYPTLNSALPSGLPWSYRLLLSASENATRYGANVELLSLTKTFEHTADAVATLTLELAVISTYAASITTGHLALLIAYTDTAGLQQLEKANWSITPRAETTALTSSAAAWTLNDYGSHVAKKIAHTTAYAVKRNTEIEVSLMLRRVMPAQVEIFVDPDIAVTV